MLEHGHDQGPAVRQILDRDGYADVDTIRDMEDRDRVTLGRSKLDLIAIPRSVLRSLAAFVAGPVACFRRNFLAMTYRMTPQFSRWASSYRIDHAYH
jgi:hypothetical protein